MQACVHALGLDPVHCRGGNEPAPAALLDNDTLQPARLGFRHCRGRRTGVDDLARGRLPRLQQRCELRGSGVQALLPDTPPHASHGLGKATVIERLDQVVHRLRLEGAHGMLIPRGHEGGWRR